mmetsp:Transcript_8752/g.26539  ORF Transcript_8752/g.26539 Transcript_8752/m.26539 type:complete len:224 (-) Transcript_8752:200-871(-)
MGRAPLARIRAPRAVVAAVGGGNTRHAAAAKPHGARVPRHTSTPGNLPAPRAVQHHLGDRYVPPAGPRRRRRWRCSGRAVPAARVGVGVPVCVCAAPTVVQRPGGVQRDVGARGATTHAGRSACKLRAAALVGCRQQHGSPARRRRCRRWRQRQRQRRRRGGRCCGWHRHRREHASAVQLPVGAGEARLQPNRPGCRRGRKDAAAAAAGRRRGAAASAQLPPV